jgi:glycosyltransferase involved in cell wall biosynthesis
MGRRAAGFTAEFAPFMSAPPPLVAVLTPVHNGARFLRETMECVQAQTYPNIVHILRDNASTDATAQIIEDFAHARVRVAVTRGETLVPVGENWNAIVRLTPAEAKYFRILCADDLIAPDFIARAVEVGERHPRATVIASYFHENDGPTIDCRWPAGEAVSGREILANFLNVRGWLPAAHVLFRREALASDAHFFDDRLIAFDTDAVMRALTRGDLGIVREDLAMRRVHGATISSQELDQNMRHACEWLYFLDRYGPYALGPEESRARLKLYRRYYLRQLLKWFVRGDRRAKLHLDILARLAMTPRPADVIDALTDWPIARLGGGEVWRGYPFEA